MDLNLLALKMSGLDPITSESVNWTIWQTYLKPTTCSYCAEQNGKIFNKGHPPDPKSPVHAFCGCILEALSSIVAGTATYEGTDGADYWIKYCCSLPDNYITKDEAKDLGWVSREGNLREVTENASLSGDVFKNKKEKLPHEQGRVWYKADVNYASGYRNKQRFVYSNDGLIFVTYDHYKTFYEIT